MSYSSHTQSLAPPSRAPRSRAKDRNPTTSETSSYRLQAISSMREPSRDSAENEQSFLYSDGPSIRVEQHDSALPERSTPSEVTNTRHSTGTDITNVSLVGEGLAQKEMKFAGDVLEKVTSNRTNSDPISSRSRRTTTFPRSDEDNWSETGTKVHVPRRNLTELDVAALIFNKMIGTGIFTTPGTVLLHTKSRNISIALWTVGGVWTSIFLLVYLEFGTALPFNGGELIYLDEIYYMPELLLTILFSGFFLVLGNSYGNSISFAKNVLLSADLTKAQTTELDTRLVRFVAIAVVTLVCLLHYFSSRAGLFLNKALFWYKSVLLLIVFAVGMNFMRNNGSQWNNYNGMVERGSSLDCLAAMISIFYTYQGWENANYIAGEIRHPEGGTPAKTLKIGAFLAVGLVWFLYVLVTIAYYLVLDYDSITDKRSDLGMALYFAPKVFGSSLGMRVCLAISAFGNVLAVTYTSTKVKQAIARQRIIPFWQFFEKDLDAPKGALVLHWISTVVFISTCPTTSDGYIFTTGLFTYGHLIFSGFVTIGIFWLPKRMDEHFRFTFLKWKRVLVPVVVIFIGGNLMIVVLSARSRVPGKIPRVWWPATILLILLGSFTYWAILMLMKMEINTPGHGDESKRSIGSRIGFKIQIFKADDILPEGASHEMELAMGRV
ncbi:hypothetical protein K505DRAFT_336004 [Melanomma pulvis-pyrius CBS 109.77]|uniref:Amino acid transporter n=1 Tax=Melanomma pulvis-pyrius CBS 109.77 TaxID=1314802 RepID=A0A6A6XG81_9PLEO|nr:hypothetical protein K505DRAFT_336004 [Melanomma pulvis-pyrius CBS 109.77]